MINREYPVYAESRYERKLVSRCCVRRQGSPNEEPEWVVAERSEIHALETPRFSRGYWSRMLNFLKILTPEKVVKVPFSSGTVPRGIESSIYAAATRKRMRVSVFVRGAALYICDNSGTEGTQSFPAPPHTRCPVCNAVIDPKPGTSEQYVCAGTKKKKSECQKVWRYAREQGVSVGQAKRERAQRRIA